MTTFIQGCGSGYVDPEKLKEVVGRWLNLDVELEQLEKEAKEQRAVLVAMQAQANSLASEVRVAQGDVTSAKDEAGSVKKEIADKQGEIDNIEAKIEEVTNEIEEIEQTFRTLREFGVECFACDTLVLMADNSTKRINEVQVGDRVLAYDSETGQNVAADVIATASGEADYFYVINGDLRVTPPHPFFTAEDKWVKIVDLKAGDKIKSFAGLNEITSIEKVNSKQRICNIRVRDFHNFYVSANGKDFYLAQE
ncbi:MAG: hypothetical protein KKF26_02965 [Chloroflexi bacterium]|nr:hypothetical protein [Chloroflexota bacterium]